MNEKIASILACPKCKSRIKVKGDSLVCVKCKESFSIIGNVPIMLDNKSQKEIADSLKPKTLVSSLKQRIRFSPALYSFVKWLVSPALMLNKRHKKILKELGKDTLVLDLGSGSRRVDSRAINFDIAPYPNVDVVGDGYNLPFRSEAFDFVILNTVLEHVRDPSGVLLEARRVLKKGGYIYATVPFMFKFHSSPEDYYRWTISGVSELFSTFKELEKGVTAGPSSTLIMVVSDFLAIILSFESETLYTFWYILFGILLKPLKLLDFLLVHAKNAHNISSILFFVGKK